MAAHLGVHPVTFRKWMSQKITMDATQIVSMAMLFQVTAEELVLGEEGKSYVLEWAGANGAKWRPPPRVQNLVDVATELEENEISMLTAMAKTYLDQRDTKPKTAANQ